MCPLGHFTVLKKKHQYIRQSQLMVTLIETYYRLVSLTKCRHSEFTYKMCVNQQQQQQQHKTTKETVLNQVILQK